MILAEEILRRALLPDLIVDARPVQVIKGGGVGVFVAYDISAILTKLVEVPFDGVR
ncbi:MAG TPA: hypothetical protein VIW67_00445 [Terriglobales bacterium]